jgi:hypothetical protein
VSVHGGSFDLLFVSTGSFKLHWFPPNKPNTAGNHVHVLLSTFLQAPYVYVYVYVDATNMHIHIHGSKSTHTYTW